MSGLPKRLRQAMRLRARAFHSLREACLTGGVLVFHRAKRLSDLDRYIQRREWQRDPDFDPIAMGC